MDLASLREKLANMNRRGSKGNDLWKPKDEHVVRLLPPDEGQELFQELSFHYDIGDATIPCPRANNGEECEICDFADTLKSRTYADGAKKPDNINKEDFELFKKIQSKSRCFTKMAERVEGQPLTGKWWSLTPKQAQQALEVCADGDRLAEVGIDKDDGEGALKTLYDTKKAYDLQVSLAQPGKKGNNQTFPLVSIKGKIRATPLAKTDAEIEEVLKSTRKLSEVYPKMPAAEVTRLFKKFVAGGAPADAADAKPEGTKYAAKEAPKSAKPTNSQENAKLAGTRSIDDAFDDLLENKEA
jgi:hypothetical protein